MKLVGLVVEIKYDIYHVEADDRLFLCKQKGILKFNKDEILVGDKVEFDSIDLIIEKKFERTNQFVRPRIANVNQALIIVSIIEPDLSFYLLTKYLITLEAQNVRDIIICLTKTDLINKQDKKYQEIICQLKQDKYLVIDTNNVNDLKLLEEKFKNKTSFLIGQTGVGKSTLINKIIQDANLKTQEISRALNRGKHTTTIVKLIKFLDGYIADTPGFSSFELNLTKFEKAKSFHDFDQYATKCKFFNCLHINEKDCCVRKMYEENKISKWRYENYLRILNEDNNNGKKTK